MITVHHAPRSTDRWAKISPTLAVVGCGNATAPSPAASAVSGPARTPRHSVHCMRRLSDAAHSHRRDDSSHCGPGSSRSRTSTSFCPVAARFDGESVSSSTRSRWSLLNASSSAEISPPAPAHRNRKRVTMEDGRNNRLQCMQQAIDARQRGYSAAESCASTVPGLILAFSPSPDSRL